ncbi:MAG TPA: sigma-70 family RNA polymerase sigma factor [Longimicrobiaceae bacterium]|nr:sigma-70 family RNA polymerase sigma factor [Longimicrobiaceae bacterium]
MPRQSSEEPDAGTIPKPGFAEEALPHLDAVYRFALRLVQGREAEAEDLVQETFLQAYRAWDTYTPGTNARAWLFTICRNRFLRREERRGRRPEVTASDVDADVEALAATAVFSEVSSADPEKAFFDSFLDEEVVHAVDALPEPFREAVVLSDLEGLSYPDLAEVLGVPVGTVKSRLFRGRRLLQQALYEYALEMGYIRPGDRS